MDFSSFDWSSIGVDSTGLDTPPVDPWVTTNVTGTTDAGGGNSILSALTGLLGYAGKTYVDVAAADARAKTMAQYGWQAGYAPNRYPQTISPVAMLLILGLIVFAVEK